MSAVQGQLSLRAVQGKEGIAGCQPQQTATDGPSGATPANAQRDPPCPQRLGSPCPRLPPFSATGRAPRPLCLVMGSCE